MFDIQLRQYNKRGANGDRDMVRNTPYADYEVVLIRRDTGAEEVLQKFAGYDNFWSAPVSQAHLRREVDAYLAEKAAFFNAQVLPVREMREKITVTTEWVEDDPLRDAANYDLADRYSQRLTDRDGDRLVPVTAFDSLEAGPNSYGYAVRDGRADIRFKIKKGDRPATDATHILWFYE